MSWLGPASKRKEEGKGRVRQRNGPQTGCKIGLRTGCSGGRREVERLRRAIEALDERRYKSVIGFSVNSQYTQQGDPVSIPSASAEDNPRLGPYSWIIVSVI